MVSEKIIYVFPIISEWQIMTFPVCGLFGPQGHGRQDLLTL